VKYLAKLGTAESADGVDSPVYLATWTDAPQKTFRLDLARRFESKSELKRVAAMVGFDRVETVEVEA